MIALPKAILTNCRENETLNPFMDSILTIFSQKIAHGLVFFSLLELVYFNSIVGLSTICFFFLSHTYFNLKNFLKN